jgi:hypothetical protein
MTKPTANLEAITSPTDLNADGYTKNVLIQSGGTMNVARNEMNSGLRRLTHFLKRTSSTNVIILDISHLLIW